MNEGNQGPTILAVCWILVLVPGLVLSVRIWCKAFLSRVIGWDDFVICLAWVFIYNSLKVFHPAYTGTVSPTHLHRSRHKSRSNGRGRKTRRKNRRSKHRFTGTETSLYIIRHNNHRLRPQQNFLRNYTLENRDSDMDENPPVVHHHQYERRNVALCCVLFITMQTSSCSLDTKTHGNSQMLAYHRLRNNRSCGRCIFRVYGLYSRCPTLVFTLESSNEKTG